MLVLQHIVGTAWANMLWVTMYRLVDKHGFVDDLFPPQLDDNTRPDFYLPPSQRVAVRIPRYGNALMLQ